MCKFVGLASFLLSSMLAVSAWGQAGTTTVISVNDAGVQADDTSNVDSMSADGRYVVIRSSATNLVPGVGENGNKRHIYVHDRDADNDGVFDEPGAIKIIAMSVSSTGELGNKPSTGGKISPDGRFVAFESSAGNLVPSIGKVNTPLIFLHDRDADNDGIFDEPGAITTEVVSISVTGGLPDRYSFGPSISADGRYVGFWSNATNLTTETDMNGGTGDIYVRDRKIGVTRRVSIAADGAQGNSDSVQPSISADGRFVAFGSMASNLVPGGFANAGYWDIYVHDRDADNDGVFDEPGAIATERASVSDAGEQGNDRSLGHSISVDGRFVVYYSFATNLHPSIDPDSSGPYVLVRDRETGSTSLISVDNSGTANFYVVNTPTISADGRYVAFESNGTDLVSRPDENGTIADIFVHDRDTDEDGIFDEPGATATDMVSISSTGVQGNATSLKAMISADGRYVGFSSNSTNLIAGGDANGSKFDDFVHDMGGPNQPPVATCRDVTVATDPGLCTATANIDGGSSDPDGEPITLAQSPPGPFGLGQTEAALTVTDGAALFDSCKANVKVVDLESPKVTCPVPQTLECSGTSGEVAYYGQTSGDNCSVTASACDVPSGSTFTMGATSVVCFAVDGNLNRDSCDFTVVVVDTTPPEVTADLILIARIGHQREGNQRGRERGRGHHKGRYEIAFAASDGCDPSISATAVLDVVGWPSPISVTNGQIVDFASVDRHAEIKTKRNFLKIMAPGMVLRVTSIDSAGNATTTEVGPTFHGGDNL